MRDVISDGISDDWDAPGPPLIDDPEARRLARVGVVDVGSNSVRLVVFDGAARSPAYFFNEKVLCGLGEGLGETGRLNPDGRVRALAALRRFQRLAGALDLAPLSVVATAAVRDAADGADFRDEVARETGLKLHVISGADEARLSAQGVLLGWPQASGLVCDIGGSSMELAELSGGQVGRCTTAPLGPLKLGGLRGGKGRMRAYIDGEMRKLAEEFTDGGRRLFLVGGSWRAIAKLDMARRNYPLKVLHEYRLPPNELRKTIKWIASTDPTTLRRLSGVGSDRMSLVPIAAQVLDAALRILRPREIFVSGYGLREGLLWEEMSAKLRARDPLIEACRFAEAKDARVPGFGKTLYKFIKPLFPRHSEAKLRIIKAACLLHDVTWRTHPDYRAEVCFDYATRANLGGLSHSERIFLALALLHRYRSSRSGARFGQLLKLVDERQAEEAEILGKAMRFGAMFTAERHDRMGRLRWHPGKRHLSLIIGPEAQALFGEVAQARFASLGKALGADTDTIARPTDNTD